jgi:ABC-type enterochelin transport system substrate-binding protein
MTDPTRAASYPPFVQFLSDINEEINSDEDLIEVMNGIADTLGDMFGFQSNRHELVANFVARLHAAADASAQTQVMTRN